MESCQKVYVIHKLPLHTVCRATRLIERPLNESQKNLQNFLFSNKRNKSKLDIFTFLCKLRTVSHLFVYARFDGVKIREKIYK